MAVAAATAFLKTGDFVRGHSLAILGNLLDQGVKVALVYGDRDYQCNCKHRLIWKQCIARANAYFAGYGGEQISLNIASKTSKAFSNAGYTEILTNKTHVGGYVRQFGGLSFSRVLDAGHEGNVSCPPDVDLIAKHLSHQHPGTNPKHPTGSFSG